MAIKKEPPDPTKAEAKAKALKAKKVLFKGTNRPKSQKNICMPPMIQQPNTLQLW